MSKQKKSNRLYTNGAYEISGVMKRDLLKGIVRYSMYPNVYEVGEKVCVPKYNTREHKKLNKPQFILVRLKRELLIEKYKSTGCFSFF